MSRTLTISFDKSDEDVSVMCVVDAPYFGTVNVINMITGEKAERLYNELTGQNVIVKAESGEEEYDPDFVNRWL